MRAVRHVALLLLFALPLAAQTPIEKRMAAQSERGFVAEKAYQFDGMDSVNLFNGNLTLTLPLGGGYPVSSQLSYAMKLSYNSKVWELREGGQRACTEEQPNSFAAFPSGAAHWRASAGLGWTFSLGQLFLPGQLSTSSPHAYISPDGAIHHFNPGIPITGNDDYTTVAYAADSSLLRVRVTTSGNRELELPDGAIHTFGSTGLLTRMSDRFGNGVDVTYATSGGKWIWTLTDAHRTQVITFADAWLELDATNRFEELRWIAESIDLAAFSPDGVSEPVGRYELEYDYAVVRRGCATGFPFAPCSGSPEVPLLKLIRWVPDQSTYTFEYNTTTENHCQQGTLKKLTLPTGGAIAWTHGTYTLPANGCGFDPGAGTDARNYTPGVIKKTLYATDGTTVVGEWNYKPALGPVTRQWGVCEDITLPGGTPTPVEFFGYQHVTNTVTDPLGRAAVNYFATWTDENVSTSGNLERDYGLPFTRTHPAPAAPDAPTPRYLSQQICALGATSCSVLRSTYLRYDDLAPEPRVLAERTVFDDDTYDAGGAVFKHHLDSASSNWDGLGHHRTTTVSSSFGPARTSFRDFNGDSGTAAIPVDDPWLVNTYTRDEVSEGPATAVSQVCFDEATGVLLGKRALKGTSIDANDVVVRYGYASGDAISEDWYGGDQTDLVSNDLCATPAAATEPSQYHIDHTYEAGVRESSTYRDAAFKSFDVTIDGRSGLATTSRDGAGAGTTYSYDELGRIKEARPAGEVWTHYTYETTSRPATVKVRTYGPAVTDIATATPISDRRHYYDGLGRLIQTRDQMPGGWSVVNHTYDAAGQRIKTSMPEMRSGSAYESFTPSFASTFAFDRFGRIRSTTAPDGKKVTNTYTGTRLIDRTVDVSGKSVVTSEVYDAHGRLTSVTENATSATGAMTTAYGYDVGNRLSSVDMAKDGVTQERRFVYDNRGFLLAESHPEKGAEGKGVVLYGAFSGPAFVPAYDARGHVLRRTDGFGTAHDLQFTYDEAERLTKVEDRDANGNRRTLKQLDYADANVPTGCTPGATNCNAAKGKLVSAVRYNNAPDLGQVSVTETYEYKGLGGRPTKRVTTVGGTTSFAGATFTLNQAWDTNGFLESLTYPSTSAAPMARTVTMGYANGLLTSVDGYATITYQPNGLVDAVTHGTGSTAVTEKWIPDPHRMARPQRIEVTRQTSSLWSSGDYSYDGSGNITAIGNRSYTYDPFGRLTRWMYQNAGASETVHRRVDPFGNYLETTFQGCTPTSGPFLSCYTSSTLGLTADGETNHYDSVTYDDAGSVTHDGFHGYGYDAAAMMTSLTGAGRDERFLYTADDERIAIVDRASNKTTWTLRGTDHRLLRTFKRASVAGNTGWQWVEDEIYRGAQLLASESPQGRRQYHLDHLGSPRLITNTSGTVLGEQYFAPFGESTTTTGGRLQFTGHERDIPENPAAGAVLDYMHARYYSAGLGRFLSVDPTWESADISNPQSWNRYAYVRNNPISRTDPDGRVDGNGMGEPLEWTYPRDRRRQLEYSNRTAKGIVSGTVFLGSLFVPGPEDVAIGTVAVALGRRLIARVVSRAAVAGADEGVEALERAMDVSNTIETAASGMTALSRYYPANNGFAGTPQQEFLMPGQLIDRHGGSGVSRFFSPVGTPTAARSLPPGTANQPLRTFEVLKPFEVQSGRVAPAFGQPGGGKQYASPVQLDVLMRRGFLREIHN